MSASARCVRRAAAAPALAAGLAPSVRAAAAIRRAIRVADPGRRQEGQGARLERDPEDQAAQAGGGRPVERRAPDGARRSPAAADLVPAHHSGRGRLRRSGPTSRASPAFTAALMREGTASRTSEQISQQLEVMAATPQRRRRHVAPGSDDRAARASAIRRPADRPRGRRPAASDVFRTRSSRATSSARARTLTQQRANPGFLAAEMFSRGVYGTHPAARLVMSLSPDERDKLNRLLGILRDGELSEGELHELRHLSPTIRKRVICTWKVPF